MSNTKDNKINDKNKISTINIFLTIFALIIDILIPIMTSYFDDIEINWITAIAAIIFVLVLYTLGCFITKKIYNLISKDIINKEIEIICTKENSIKTQDLHNVCPIHGYHCCMLDLHDSKFYKDALNHLEVSKESLSRYGLLSFDSFQKVEQDFFRDHPNGEIWVISSELETEIKSDRDSKNNSHTSTRLSLETVRENVKAGKRYIQFVSIGPSGEYGIAYKSRKDLYWSVISDENERPFRLPIIRIDSDFSKVNISRNQMNDPDWAYIIELTSTIIFVDESKGDYEGYFYLRPEYDENSEPFEQRTIFYKMPTQCMLTGFIKDLSERRKRYFNSLRIS